MMNARSALSGLKHQKEKRNMDYFAGLDVSVKETSICIVDDTGKIVRETRVASEPEALLTRLVRAIAAQVTGRAPSGDTSSPGSVGAFSLPAH
jgi:predicted NBD/HSP70 family sugar kinase